MPLIMKTKIASRYWLLPSFIWVAFALVSSGCVERRYTIRTDPPGALAYVNGEEIGTTPVSRSFTYYGDREITLVHDGYETQRIVQPIKAPWWDNLLTEFVSENLIPWTMRDERNMTFQMVPNQDVSDDSLTDRAEQMRKASQGSPADDEPPRRGFSLFRQ
jgi:hypothetical protein